MSKILDGLPEATRNTIIEEVKELLKEKKENKPVNSSVVEFAKKQNEKSIKAKKINGAQIKQPTYLPNIGQRGQ